jgi:hypothetical protein
VSVDSSSLRSVGMTKEFGGLGVALVIKNYEL